MGKMRALLRMVALLVTLTASQSTSASDSSGSTAASSTSQDSHYSAYTSSGQDSQATPAGLNIEPGEWYGEYADVTPAVGCAASTKDVRFTKSEFGGEPDKVGCPMASASIVPTFFYPPLPPVPTRGVMMMDKAPGGVPVVALFLTEDSLLCAGTLVAEKHVLTSLECAMMLTEGVRGDDSADSGSTSNSAGDSSSGGANRRRLLQDSSSVSGDSHSGDAGVSPYNASARIGNSTFMVMRVIHDPRGTSEQLALLLLDRKANYPPIRLDDGGHIGNSSGDGSCNAIALELVSPPDVPGGVMWEPLDVDMEDTPTALSGYHLKWDMDRSSCRYDAGEQTGLCGAGPTMQAGPVLSGTPLLAYALKDGRATAVLAGVVTEAGIPMDMENDVLARVAAAQQWILAATGAGRFPAVKIYGEITSLSGEANLTGFSGASVDHAKGVTIEPCDTPAMIDDAGTGALTFLLESRDMRNDVPSDDDPMQKLAPPRAYGFVWKVGCEKNFEGKAGGAACVAPFAGGINGCIYATDRVTETCKSPECRPSVTWQDVRKLQQMGKAFDGGLGKRTSKSDKGQFDTWMCMRDWNATEQLACGLGPHELGCFHFEEVHRNFVFVGSNADVKMVHEHKRVEGLGKERTKVRSLASVFPPRPRAAMADSQDSWASDSSTGDSSSGSAVYTPGGSASSDSASASASGSM